jgi:hypothetical protein
MSKSKKIKLRKNKKLNGFETKQRETYRKDFYSSWTDGMKKYCWTRGMKILQAIMAAGKTYAIHAPGGIWETIEKLDPDIRVHIIDTPRADLKSDDSLVLGIMAFAQRHKKNAIVVYGFEFLKTYMMNDNPDNVYIFVETTQWLTRDISNERQNYNDVIDLCVDNNLKFSWISDEIHLMATSRKKYITLNSGSPPTKLMKFKRYKMCDEITKYTYHSYGITATLVWEQKEFKKAINNYIVLDSPTKEDSLLRAATIDKFVWMDYDKKTATNESFDETKFHFQNYVMDTFALQRDLDNIKKFYNLNTDLKKVTGIIKVYGNLPERISIGQAVALFNDIDVPYDEWGIITIKSKKEVGSKANKGTYNTHLYKKEEDDDGNINKGMVQVENDFRDIQDVYRSIRDPESPYRFLVVIDMGSVGINIDNLHTFFSFREPTTYSDKNNPVVKSLLQTLGRILRLKYMYEIIRENKHLSDKECIEIWAKLNRTIAYLPKNDYYERLIEEYQKEYYMTDEVIEVLKNKLGNNL